MFPLDGAQSKLRKMAKRLAFSYPSVFPTEVSQDFLAPNLKCLKDQGDIDISSSKIRVFLGDFAEEEHVKPRNRPRFPTKPVECIENEAGTDIMRSESPLHTRQLLLRRLDTKEYPLASKLPPSSLFGSSNENDFEKDNRRTKYLSKDEIAFRSLQEPPTQSTINIKGWNPKTCTCSDQKRIKNTKSNSTGRASEDFPLLVDKLNLEGMGSQIPTNSKQSTRSKEINIQYKNFRSSSESNSKFCKALRRRGRRPSTKLQENQPFPVTPEVSRLKLSILDDSVSTKTVEKSDSSHLDNQPKGFYDFQSLSGTLSQDNFHSAVATPPIAESDFEPFVAQVLDLDQCTPHQSADILAAQRASLPSPGLSPIYTPNETEFNDEETSSNPSLKNWINHASLHKSELNSSFGSHPFISQIPEHTLFNMQSITETFDSMPSDLKNLMIFQLLRGCSRRTLHIIADIVNPALKCDFLAQLPFELSLQILSFLDHRDLCRSAQVSKQWRNIIDSNETGWKELFDRDGFVLPKGELERAIKEGWGWQDPYGLEGFEQDLSVPKCTSPYKNSSDDEICETSLCVVPNRRSRGTGKRKRASVGSERSKRRVMDHELFERSQVTARTLKARFHKSEGPLTAANAAILAVPDPKLGLPSLRKLHLFKSLYRRHYLLQHSWMNGKVAPNHFAFPAHTAHVITCLQFDDDKIITGSDDTLINVYDTKTGAFRKKLEGHEGGVWALQYEGNVLVSGSTDRSVRVWDIEKGLCTQVFHGHTSTVRCLLILMPQMVDQKEKKQPIMVPEKPLIITGSRDSQLRVWRLPGEGSKRYIQTGPPANDADCPYFVRILTGHAHSVRAISAHQDTLVSGSYDNTVRVWKISTGQTIHRLTGHTMKVYSVVLDHKRDRCISGSMDNFVKIWSIDTGACLFTLEGHTSLVGLLDLHAERLVSAAADSTLRIWDPGNGQCKSTLSAHTGAITCFQHDGQKVISGSDRTLKLWNIKTGECLKDLLVDLSGVWQVKFDERRCVAAVQRDNLTYVLDFGASRDGVPANQRGSRKLLSDSVEQAVAIDENRNL
ncbi:putative E3 ubiquitin ligase complex SCF subunit sconB [Erysiphe neolycopersici]|uniref:Putative E3 ubiquitin ligase complex SCF subunit sconB n=1 Tax=Erysiphe neolycopersici TaxID=212602 RepID=A0A420HXP4_9PEZI|nr:putative E3 ubiquitin ligase complex SCF subunit sconB [Erysiphe neolycopersici]